MQYHHLAQESYHKNVIAYRCISLIATSTASIGFTLYRNDKKIDSHPLLTLLKHPNPYEAGTSFFEKVLSYKLISGNSYVKWIKPKTRPPTELYTLRPDRITILTDRHYTPIAYQHRVGLRCEKFPITPNSKKNPLLHIKHFNPLDEWLGFSPLQAAAHAINQHNQACQWNQSLLKNSARPSGALIAKRPLNPDQILMLKESISDEFVGPDNTGRPMLLENGLDWREISLTPKDMELSELKHTSARDTALALGVPPQLLGIPGDNKYTNFQEARQAFYEHTILPHLDNLVDHLNHWLTPHFSPHLTLSYSTDNISALSTKRDAHWHRINQATFLTDEEKRKLLGVERESRRVEE